MSWDWEKLKQQQRGINLAKPRGGTDSSGYATEIGAWICSIAWKLIVVTSVLMGIGFFFGLGVCCAVYAFAWTFGFII